MPHEAKASWLAESFLAWEARLRVPLTGTTADRPASADRNLRTRLC